MVSRNMAWKFSDLSHQVLKGSCPASMGRGSRTLS
uniref:Uncharacterized protein n=1 Tax=Trichinella nativa TaxID=6335 RepID=A0A0V1KI47_9BILA